MVKTALVTGANKGIGYAIAQQLLEQGYTVLVGARDAGRGEAAVRELQTFGNAELLLVDVADLDSIHAAVASITANYDGLGLWLITLESPVIWIAQHGSTRHKNCLIFTRLTLSDHMN